MLKYVIDYVSAEVNPKIYYMQLDGNFAKKPYRYFEGDDTYPDYYRAKWHDLDDLFKVLESLPTLRTSKGERIRYRIIALHIRFIDRGPGFKKIPKWESKIIGPW
jgi:hypothetical protein